MTVLILAQIALLLFGVCSYCSSLVTGIASDYFSSKDNPRLNPDRVTDYTCAFSG